MMMGGNIVLDLIVLGVRDDMGILLKQCTYLTNRNILVFGTHVVLIVKTRPHLPEKHFAHIFVSGGQDDGSTHRLKS